MKRRKLPVQLNLSRVPTAVPTPAGGASKASESPLGTMNRCVLAPTRQRFGVRQSPAAFCRGCTRKAPEDWRTPKPGGSTCGSRRASLVLRPRIGTLNRAGRTPTRQRLGVRQSPAALCRGCTRKAPEDWRSPKPGGGTCGSRAGSGQRGRSPTRTSVLPACEKHPRFLNAPAEPRASRRWP